MGKNERLWAMTGKVFACGCGLQPETAGAASQQVSPYSTELRPYKYRGFNNDLKSEFFHCQYYNPSFPDTGSK